MYMALFVLANLTMIPVMADQQASGNVFLNSQGFFTQVSQGIPLHGLQQRRPMDQQTSFFSRFSPRYAHILFQVGGFSAMQGRAQNIGIEGLIGDRFTVTHHDDQNMLLGVGYFLNKIKQKRFSVLYGINTFYLAHTLVQGDVVQEDLFTNLSYRYSITNLPIYIAVKTLISVSDKYNITVDLGIGPNIIQTSGFSESSLDEGIAIPDDAFSGRSSIALSATIGIGLKLNNLLGRLPLEIGYRFFYLGQGYLAKETNQLMNNLNTGNSYANALVMSTAIN